MLKSLFEAVEVIEEVDAKADELVELRDQAEGVVGQAILAKRRFDRHAKLKRDLEENAERENGPSELRNLCAVWDFFTSGK